MIIMQQLLRLICTQSIYSINLFKIILYKKNNNLYRWQSNIAQKSRQIAMLHLELAHTPLPWIYIYRKHSCYAVYPTF